MHRNKVTFINQKQTAYVSDGETILSAMEKAGFTPETPCNKKGICGKCKVTIFKENKKCEVLACQTKIWGDLKVIWNPPIDKDGANHILNEGKTLTYSIHAAIMKKYNGKHTVVYADGLETGYEEGNTEEKMYGISVDIGTTTLVTSLIDMSTGRELTSLSSFNPQTKIAQDLISRIEYCSRPEGLNEMFTSLIKELNHMIQIMCEKINIEQKHIYEIICCGNTVMFHIAANKNPKSLGKAPYIPVSNGNVYEDAKKMGILVSPFARIYYPSIISSFIGADITAGILAANLFTERKTIFFIDIGTNGEMLLLKDGNVQATSVAAGPAFEGMNITFGMRAGTGAIEHFSINEKNEVSVDIIGGGIAKGICGSGLFDIAGELCRAGLIQKNGRLRKAEELDEENPLRKRLCTYNGKVAFQITDHVFLTAGDIRQIQLAKGAIALGIQVLLEKQNMTADEVDKVLIAGSFGYHLRLESLFALSVLPEEFTGKIEFLGNTSKTGGTAFLLHKEYRNIMEDYVKNIETVELAKVENYRDIFMKALWF